MDQYTGNGQQLILMRTVEAKLPIKTHLLPFGKHDLEYPNRGLAVGQAYLYLERSNYCSTYFVLRVEYSRAAVQYVLCSNHYDGSNIPQYLPCSLTLSCSFEPQPLKYVHGCFGIQGVGCMQ